MATNVILPSFNVSFPGHYVIHKWYVAKVAWKNYQESRESLVIMYQEI